ncbi:fibronectin-binding protein [Lachnospiraceae bacterium KM106-2]|nr:fibronectin-binding protein [Lachnospiraceae bacterium KM106-2]
MIHPHLLSPLLPYSLTPLLPLAACPTSSRPSRQGAACPLLNTIQVVSPRCSQHRTSPSARRHIFSLQVTFTTEILAGPDAEKVEVKQYSVLLTYSLTLAACLTSSRSSRQGAACPLLNTIRVVSPRCSPHRTSPSARRHIFSLQVTFTTEILADTDAEKVEVKQYFVLLTYLLTHSRNAPPTSSRPSRQGAACPLLNTIWVVSPRCSPHRTSPSARRHIFSLQVTFTTEILADTDAEKVEVKQYFVLLTYLLTLATPHPPHPVQAGKAQPIPCSTPSG